MCVSWIIFFVCGRLARPFLHIFFFKWSGDPRNLHRVDRRQRQMCIRDSTGLPRRKRYRHLYRTCPASGIGRSGSRFHSLCQWSTDQSGMGTYGRRYGQHFIIGQLDVALPLSRGRRCPSVHSRKGIKRFLLCSANQCTYRKRLFVHDSEISRRRESNLSGNLSLIHIWRCRRSTLCRFRGVPDC